jgi:hypothetical protein
MAPSHHNLQPGVQPGQTLEASSREKPLLVRPTFMLPPVPPFSSYPPGYNPRPYGFTPSRIRHAYGIDQITITYDGVQCHGFNVDRHRFEGYFPQTPGATC